MTTERVYAFGQFGSYASAADVPTEFRLLMAGDNDTITGKLVFDDISAKSVMSTWATRGIDLMADYEHMSLEKPPIPAPASAKKWTPEMREGELWATNIAWTDKARDHISAGEYRYFSVAVEVEKKTLRVASFINFALTNLPAANGIKALMAASQNAIPTEDTEMKTVIVALGLRAESSEADALVAVSSLKDFEREIIALTGKADRAGAIGSLRAMAQSHDQVVALNAKVKQIESEKRMVEFDAVVKAGSDLGKISPAMAAGEWIRSLRAREDGIVSLNSFLADAPQLIRTEAAVEPKSSKDEPGQVTFGKDEVEVANRFGADLQKIAAFRLAKQGSQNTVKNKDGGITVKVGK